MQKRERILFLVAAAAVLLWLGLPKVNAFFFGGLDEARDRLAAVEEQLALKTKDAARITAAGATLKQWRSRSLPPDPLVAQRLYQVWLTDLAQIAELTEVKVTPGRRTPKGKVYTAVLVSLEGKATISRLSRFLYYFYRTDLPHRVVTLNVESGGTRDDAVHTVSLTAEGLSFTGVPPRAWLFPQTTIQREFRSQSSPQTMEVADATHFPTEAGFRIRAGNEYLLVTARNGTQWTVQGGVDGTRTDRHAVGETLELAPIHPEYAAKSQDDYRSLIENSPFAKPSPRSSAPPPSRSFAPSQPPIARDSAAEETFLVATIIQDDEPQAWLYRRSSGTQTVLQEGSQLAVSDVKGTVVEIGADHLLLQNVSGTWRLRLGDNLRSMQRVASPETPQASTPAVARPAAPPADSAEEPISTTAPVPNENATNKSDQPVQSGP
jgi:hypothetical protein